MNNIFETMTKSELINECLRMNKDLIARAEWRIDELERRIEWLKQMNKGLVELSMEILRSVNNEKQCDN